MSFSQVEMAALVQVEGGTHLAICGDLTEEEGRTLESAEIFFVVHQDASFVRGCGRYRTGETGEAEWGACADLTQQPLKVGKAVAMGLVVVERDNPVSAERGISVGFTTFTWMQDITILDRLPVGRINPCAGERGAPR
jgi:hypothetical protein